MDNERIQILIEKYLAESATLEEEGELMDWYRTSNEKEIEWPVKDANKKKALQLEMLAAIQRKAFRRERKPRKWARVAAAAAILLCLSVGGYFLVHQRRSTDLKIVQHVPEDIKPGASGAILTLANGKKMVLGQLKAGTVARQGRADLQKRNDSLLVYQRTDAAAQAHEVSYNTLETPKGRQFQLLLPDGTRVWLNAASSLKYPTTFTGKTRTVELNGEAYFEVAHRQDQPFRVVTHSQVIEDIGTQFDVKAYADEPAVRTILLEGAVKVIGKTTGAQQLLRPGEQAIGDQELRVEKIDAQAAVAWKDGRFVFRSESVRSIMRQIARWYNVEIVYQTDVSAKRVWGTVSRYADVSEVLNMIALTGVAHFRVEGRKILVVQ